MAERRILSLQEKEERYRAKPLTALQAADLEEVRRRGGVFVTLDGDTSVWRFIDGSGQAHTGRIKALIRKGLLTGGRDSMFGTEPQTYHARP
ncbi:MAG TPA: hypothetical protein VN838_06810 [Bradyrhizobium sp.]|nr:hypothetical protein [Bradyrhizobium sp.]